MVRQLNVSATNDVSVVSNVNFQNGYRQTGSSFNFNPGCDIDVVPTAKGVLWIHQLETSVTNDAVLQTTFILSMAVLKFNMAAAKLEVVFTSTPNAILTPFQRE